jgi:selenocysteine-specific elongation factor
VTTAAHPLVVGTAGHIDHGKTALVHALTGIDTDRLPVEKARGITTELGFAHLDVGGRTVAVVDVPGHERFIKSMVAGAGGVDLVVLVIAADEGVMPQTREHLDICQLLGVRRGVVVLTKRDLVDDEWLALVEGEVRTFVDGTFLAGAPVVAVSARTGAGLDDLRRALADAIAELPPREAAGAFRLPLDRIFTLRGFGTVVTGTVASGEVAVGDELVALPRGAAGRVRGIQIHGLPADRARAGLRAALNLGGIATDDLVRGDVLVHPGAALPSHILDVRFRLLPTARPLGRRTRVLLHHGTAQVMASLVLVGADRLGPGDQAVAQLRLDARTPLAALPGDRFIARGFVALANYGTTIGGGEVVRVLAAKARGAATGHAEAVRRLADARLTERIALEVRGAGPAGLDRAAIAHRTGQVAGDVAAPVDELAAAGELLRAGDDHPVFLHAEVVAELEARLRALVDAAPADGAPREELRTRLPAALPHAAFDGIVDGLARRGRLTATAERLARPAPRAPAPSPDDERLAEAFRGWGRSPPRPREAAAAAGMAEPAARAAMTRMLAAGRLIKVKPDLYLDAGVVAELRAELLAYLDQHGEITPQAWKELCGTSRKYSIPLAEFFDGEKTTLRVGDVRRRRK